jgi:ribonuclease HI
VHDADMVDEVVALELRLLEPEVRADRAEVERLLHPEFREIGASGRLWDRESMVAALAEDPGTGATASEVDTRELADGVVLVTYVAESPAGRSRRSSVWVRGDDGWRVLFHQGTRCLT